MNKAHTLAVIIIMLFSTSRAANWERLYSMKSTDCFRHVREVPNGDFILAGYTADFNSHDTDGIVIRMDDNGDTIWTFKYNGPNSKEDCFYKVAPTSDGGFIVCGYSKSFGGGENALYLKLNSSGVLQWVKNWGGSGIERAQDIVELPNGKFVLTGYSTSSPAHYYDAFILKISSSGNTEWSKLYGWNNYDDANSIKLLSDGGFILGGQSNNDLFLIRTDNNGDSLWTKILGTSGIDNIECVNFAQGGDGYILSGHTDGPGNGGDNGYIVRTDTGGNEIWSKTYGGNDNDDFHRIEQTSDGGYIASGTSASGPWPNPNIWILKMDSAGVKDWENFFGGDNHDHGYGGQQTSDGGYIVVGHSHSFANNNFNEDAFVIKTNSSGQVNNHLNYTTVTDLVSPVSGICSNSNVQIVVDVTNYGDATVSSIPVTVEITGAITQTLTQTYSSSVTRDQTKTLTFSTGINMSAGGTYNFHCYTGNPHNVIPERNYLDKTITVNSTTATPAVSNGTHCGPGPVALSATSSSTVKWYTASSGGSSVFTGTAFNTPYITANTTYYASAGTTCPSARVPVTASITPGLTPPTGSDQSRCGEGVITMTANSSNTVKWYDTPTTNIVLGSGLTFNTPYLLNSNTFYIAAENNNCTSTRVALQATVNPMPADPVTIGGSRCGAGTVQLSATGSGTIRWYNVLTGGSLLGTGSNFNTPQITQTSDFYAETFDNTCPSNRIVANAIVEVIPSAPVITPASNCGSASLALSATSNYPIEWFEDAQLTMLINTGNSFTTPLLDSTVTYFVRAVNGNCVGPYVPYVANIYSQPVVDLGPDTIMASNNSLDLDPGAGFANYLWSTTDITQILTVNTNGSYCVTVTDNNNCTASDCAYIQFSLGVDHISMNELIISPVPSTGIIYLTGSVNNYFRFQLYSADSRLVFDKKNQSNDEINLSNLPKGFYVARVSDDSHMSKYKIILE